MAAFCCCRRLSASGTLLPNTGAGYFSLPQCPPCSVCWCCWPCRNHRPGWRRENVVRFPATCLTTRCRGQLDARHVSPLRELFRPPLLRITVIGILLGSIPLVGAWAASKWMIPWADRSAKCRIPVTKRRHKAGGPSGQFWGVCPEPRSPPGLVAACLRHDECRSHRADTDHVSGHGTAGAVVSAHRVCASFVATLFFGWLPLYLPELFPTHVRATGTGIAYNAGRFATAVGVFAAGALFSTLQGSYPLVGSICSLVYLLGAVVIIWAPDTTNRSLTRD